MIHLCHVTGLDITDRARFFAPERTSSPVVEAAYNESLNNDGALDAYAETVVWRLRGVHCMVR